MSITASIKLSRWKTVTCFCIKFCYLLSEWFFCISVKACCITFQGHLATKDFVEVIEFGTPLVYNRSISNKNRKGGIYLNYFQTMYWSLWVVVRFSTEKVRQSFPPLGIHWAIPSIHTAPPPLPPLSELGYDEAMKKQDWCWMNAKPSTRCH